MIGLFVAGAIAGSINAVAGGGTLISFPSLVGLGEPEIIANATNTAALWPGSFSSAIGYRRDTEVNRGGLIGLLIPSFIGYGGARLSKRVNPKLLNAGVVALGFIVSVWLLYKAFQ